MKYGEKKQSDVQFNGKEYHIWLTMDSFEIDRFFYSLSSNKIFDLSDKQKKSYHGPW